jgi:hypothetical protein
MAPMEYSGSRRKLNHDKNLKSKSHARLPLIKAGSAKTTDAVNVLDSLNMPRIFLHAWEHYGAHASVLP